MYRAPYDLDGAGKPIVSVFRAFPQTAQALGNAEDKPIIDDYNGGGKDDVDVFRPSDKVWYIYGTTTGCWSVPFGLGADLPLPSAARVQ